MLTATPLPHTRDEWSVYNDQWSVESWCHFWIWAKWDQCPSSRALAEKNVLAHCHRCARETANSYYLKSFFPDTSPSKEAWSPARSLTSPSTLLLLTQTVLATGASQEHRCCLFPSYSLPLAVGQRMALPHTTCTRPAWSKRLSAEQEPAPGETVLPQDKTKA